MAAAPCAPGRARRSWAGGSSRNELAWLVPGLQSQVRAAQVLTGGLGPRRLFRDRSAAGPHSVRAVLGYVPAAPCPGAVGGRRLRFPALVAGRARKWRPGGARAAAGKGGAVAPPGLTLHLPRPGRAKQCCGFPGEEAGFDSVNPVQRFGVGRTRCA